MSGTEIVTIVSGLFNIAAVVAGLFGWRRHRRLKEAARRVERTGEAVIQGVEACENALGSSQAREVKRSVQAVAEAAGCEGFLHDWLAKLGLAKD
jgi:hypothetical protein